MCGVLRGPAAQNWRDTTAPGHELGFAGQLAADPPGEAAPLLLRLPTRHRGQRAGNHRPRLERPLETPRRPALRRNKSRAALERLERAAGKVGPHALRFV